MTKRIADTLSLFDLTDKISLNKKSFGDNWSKKHCHQYVNEFAFRLNEGNCERDTQDRLDDLSWAMSGKTITYQELTA